MARARARRYVDIEFTGTSEGFYEKFSIRHNIGELVGEDTAERHLGAALEARCAPGYYAARRGDEVQKSIAERTAAAAITFLKCGEDGDWEPDATKFGLCVPLQSL